MYKSARDSESDDNDEINQEVKKLARNVCDNADAMNDFSTSVMQHIKEIKSNMKELIIDIQSGLNVLSQDSNKTDSNVDKLVVSTKKHNRKSPTFQIK